MTTPEARSEQSPSGETIGFRLTNVGNQRVIDSLTLFRQEGMKGPRAAFYLLSLFEPLPAGEDDLGLIKSGESQPQTAWDQVGWAYAHPQMLTEEQKGALPALLFFPLESLANNPQVRRVGGEERDLSGKARRTAQETFEAYGKYLAKTLDPNNPTSVRTSPDARFALSLKPRTVTNVFLTIFLGVVAMGAEYAPTAGGGCSNESSQLKTFAEVADLNAKLGEKGYVYNYEFESDRDYFDVAGYYAVPKKERVTIPERTVRVWNPVLGRLVDWQAPETTYEVTHYEYFPIDQCNSEK